MALTVQKQVRYWGIAAIVLFVVLYLLGDVILPFVLGAALAYILDPLADRLERAGLGRGAAVATILISTVVLFFLIVIPAVNVIYTQTVNLVAEWPTIWAGLQGWLERTFPQILDDTSALRQQLADFGSRLSENSGNVISGVLSSVSGLFGVVLLLVVVPVVAVYLLFDWDRMIARIDSLVPRDHVGTVRRLAREMDDTLSSFIRGQGLVCLILGTFYAVSLMLLGLNFGFVAGALAGLLTFIPYVGALIGGALALGLAVYQFWGEWWWIVATGGIFAVGQFVEGNILTPKLVGSSVGLHPVWLLFALTVFGTLFGFVGMLVAVPVAAVIGVLVRFVIEEYQESPLYHGHSQTARADGAGEGAAAARIDAAPGDAASGDTSSGDAAPVDAAPGDTSSGDAAPGDAAQTARADPLKPA